MCAKRVSTFKILSFLCIALLLAISLNALIQPSRSSSTDTSYLHISSGTGSFSSIPDSHTINVRPGQKLSGGVTLTAYNAYPRGWVAPMIGMPSWGNKTDSWWLINHWIPTGISTQKAHVNVTAPQEPGVYYLIFAFSCELSGDQVASSTDWHNGPVVWDDGNDLADMDSTQFAQAQQNGVVTVNWLGADGKYGPTDTAADAIEVVVSDSALAQYSSDGQQPTFIQSDMILLVMIGIVAIAFLVLVIVASVIVLLLFLARSHNKTNAGQNVDVTKKP